ncbi:MAG TPA: ACT domain-containing protein [Mycobacteriales bacterium]|nr:ACT domain-containing protein [Mycobacteriales bacterium]
MSYLLRVVLPDRPGMLGALATALGDVGGDILSLDVVERGPDGAVDDLVVALPPGGLADRLITSAQSVEGVAVESLKIYHGTTDLHRDLQLVDELAGLPERALPLLAAHCPGVFRAGWAVVVAHVAGGVRVLHASAGAPDLAGVALPWLPLDVARRLDVREDWVPERWGTIGTELAAAPVGRPHRAVLLGRPGGPRFRASEVLRLAHLAGIASTVEERLGTG